MRIKQLQALKAVIDEHTTARAAEKLGVTQPSVSNLIAALERDLDIELFKREKGRLLPTPEAKKLALEANQIIEQLQVFEERAKYLGKLKAGELKIISLPGPAMEFIPTLIAEFLEDRPDVHIYLQIRPAIEVQNWVAEGYVDIGITELPLDTHKLDYELISLSCVCIVPGQHRLASKQVITAHDLDDEPFIALEPQHDTYSKLVSVFSQANANLNIRANVQLFLPACVLVAQGAGVSIVDPITASLNAHRDIKIIPFEPTIPFTLAIVRPINTPLSLLAQEFLTTLKKKYAPYLISQ